MLIRCMACGTPPRLTYLAAPLCHAGIHIAVHCPRVGVLLSTSPFPPTAAAAEAHGEHAGGGGGGPGTVPCLGGEMLVTVEGVDIVLPDRHRLMIKASVGSFRVALCAYCCLSAPMAYYLPLDLQGGPVSLPHDMARQASARWQGGQGISSDNLTSVALSFSAALGKVMQRLCRGSHVHAAPAHCCLPQPTHLLPTTPFPSAGFLYPHEHSRGPCRAADRTHTQCVSHHRCQL